MRQQTIARTSAAFAVLSLAACAVSRGPEANEQSKAPAAVAVGQPVDCVQTRRIHSTKVWDDYTIDFLMTDGTRYRNTLPGRCVNLAYSERFGYRTPTGQLCNSDTITVLPAASSLPGATCGLGRFVPVKLSR